MRTTESSRATAAAGTRAGGALVRGMTRWDLVGLCINGIIGAGIFGLPSSVAGILGASSPIAFALCAIVVYVFVLCFAEASAASRRRADHTFIREPSLDRLLRSKWA